MSKSGQNTQKGIFAQNWAALSLFLQFLRDKDFSYIQLEPNNSEDFDLVFKDGKKIICESKYRLEKFSYSQLKEILEVINSRKNIDGRDEILIVCRNVSEDLVSATKNIRFLAFGEPLKTKFAKLGFSDELLKYLPRVNFWKLDKIEDSELNYSLISELLNFWVPEEDVKRFTNEILQNKISQKAITGSVYTRQDFDKDIGVFRDGVQARSDFFGEKNSKITQFSKLEEDVINGKSIKWGTGSVSAFSTRWDLMSFAMDRLKQRTDLDLKKWDDLWKLNKVYYFTFGIFDVFEKNLNTDKNKKYVLNYTKKYTKTIRGFYRSDFFDVSVVKIVTKIIDGEDSSKYINDAFLIVKDLIVFNEKEFFYLKDSGYDRGQWEKGEICKLLKKIYSQANVVLKQKIFDLLISGFNIIEDDGEFSHHAPREVYEILRDWLNEDFVGRFKKLSGVIGYQYDRYYKKFSKKIDFKGFEHMGGGISYHGNHLGATYNISERHFVGFILTPAIRKFYDSNKTLGWKFIKQNCISTTKQVSKKKPDFLNRSVYEIVIERYNAQGESVSKEAFNILKEFILTKRGIPHKSDLIYQAITGSAMTDEKKWKLAELTIKEYGVPVNTFVSQIVTDLAKKGYDVARETLRQWYSNPKYYKQQMFDSDLVSSIRALFDSDLDLAISLFKALITSEYVKNKESDHFSAYSVAALLQEIIKKDYLRGLDIFRLLEAEKVLNEDQQIVYCFALFDHHGNDDSDDKDLLLKIYKDIVRPFLEKHNDNIYEICERLTVANCREAFVQFANRLAVKKEISEALRIVRIFIGDPDPYLPGKDLHDKEDKYNEHKRIENGEEPNNISTARGWCGWVLMKCSVLDGRKQVPEVIELTRRLINDENYYVVHMGCFALAQIARNRLTVLPSDRNTLFFNDEKEEALKMARNVEMMAFTLLDRLMSWPEPVQKAMTKSVLQAIDPIRTLNEEDSLKLITALTRLPKETLDDSAALFIYLAEFRKNSYKDWRFKIPGLYDYLGPENYDANKFKEITIATIRKLQKEDPDSCFRFASSVEHTMRDAEPENIDKYTEMALEYFELLTDVYAHNIFNLIYHVMESKFAKVDKYTNRWLQLLIKCLTIEKYFYERQIKKGNAREVYWYPSLYHSNLLELVDKNLGKDKFMEAAKIFFSFPKEIDLHESGYLVSRIQEIAKTDKEAKKIIKLLKDKNPSKYWDLK